MIKQVICMRRDLHMRRGKEMAQASHASLKVFFDMNMTRVIKDNRIIYSIHLPEGEIGEDIRLWIEGIFTKIVCRVNSEDELMEIYNKALDKRIPCALIQDAGRTEFKGIPTYTCCAIGPAKSDVIDEITGHLPLL